MLNTQLKIQPKYPHFKTPICSVNGKRYKYGFNGKEKDNETYGEGNTYDFGARIYDSRLGRFMSIDPLAGKNFHYSTYSSSSNSPIILIDELGMDPIVPKSWWQGKNYDIAFVAGFVDGAWESGNSAYDLIVSYNPTSPGFYTSRASQVRKDYYDMSKLVINLFSDNVLREKVYNSVTSALGNWLSETTFEKGQSYAGYTHGKLIFDVLTAIVGVAEVNALLKTGKFSIKALKIITLNRIKNSIHSYDDIIKGAKVLKNKLDKKGNKRRIEREFTGVGSAADNFENLAKKLDGKIEIDDNGTKKFKGNDGNTYSLHESSGGDGRNTITKHSIDDKGVKIEDKTRFKE